MKNVTFILDIPPYNAYSGGILVLHQLATILQQAGQSVYIYSKNSAPDSTVKLWNQNEVPDSCVVIYPEIVKGNPLRAKHVVRWILNSPGRYKSDTQSTWGDSDLVYSFIDYFTSTLTRPVKGTLRCFVNRFNKFNDCQKERSGTVYSTRKKGSKTLDKHPQSAVCIDDMLTDFDRLSSTFNSAITFYSYDSSTYYSLIAAMCGANSVVIPDKNVHREEWLSKSPTFRYGVAYGFEDLEWSVKTKHLVKPYLQELERESYGLISQFILDCYTKINE